MEDKLQEFQKKNKELEKLLRKKGVHFEKDKSKDKAKDKGKGKANLPKDKSKQQSSSAQGGAPGDNDSSSSDSYIGGESGSESDRSVREISPSQKEWEKLTGQKGIPKIIKRQKNANKIVKLLQPETFDGENPKWKKTKTFDLYMQEILRWITYQGLRQDKEESVDRFSWMCTGIALSWYNQYVMDKLVKERNIHDFILYLRKKVVPSIAADLRWKEWEEYKHSKLGPNASVNNHA